MCCFLTYSRYRYLLNENVFWPAENRGDQKEKNGNSTTDEELVDSLHGFRTICASPDGQHLAAGDRNGNLRIYDLNTLQMISLKVRPLLDAPQCCGI